MKTRIGVATVLWGAFVCGTTVAQVPAGATGQCKDSSYTTAAKKWQACSGHKGVQTWYADAKSPATPAAAAAVPTRATITAPAKQADTSSSAATSAPAPARATASQGGGPGMVWVRTWTNVYHCPGGTFYGKTKEGKYMTEADAKGTGARPDRGKACIK